MSGWQKVKLGECCDIVSGATPKTNIREYWDGGISWATPKDLSALPGAYIHDTSRKITAAGLKSCAATMLPAGSVLLSSRAPIGHVAVNTIPMTTNQGFKSLVPKEEVLEAKYLYWWLRANRSYLEKLGNGATFKEISKAVVSQVEIPLPPVNEQRRIAKVLDRADALRDKRRKALAHLDGLTQSIFFDMFDEPATNRRGMVLGTLGELVKVKSGSFLPASRMATNGEYPVLGGNGVSGYHDEYMFEEQKLVIGRVGVYCGCVHLSPPRAWVTDNALYVSELDPSVTITYLAHALRHARLNQYASQSGQPLISGSRIYGAPVLVPPNSMQLQFAERINAVEMLKAKYQVGLAESDVLFASLQDRAFRGLL